MKTVIEGNYYVKINELIKEGSYYYFLYKGEYYYFVKTSFSETELKKIDDLLLNSPKLKKRSHVIVANKMGYFITNEFILLKINGVLKETIDVGEILNFDNLVNDNLNWTNDMIKWRILWEQKLDFFEYQIHEIGKDKKIILNSFSYFLGMAEVACSYVNKSLMSFKMGIYDKVTIVHQRIFYPNYKINFYNPLLYTIDLEVRDIAEFIKSKFFAGGDVWEDLHNYFKNKKLGNLSYHLFYARMLYPSFYFDIYEKAINDVIDETELIKVIDKVGEYEQFLRQLKGFLSRYIMLFDIPWIS